MSHSCDGDKKVETICTKTLFTDFLHNIQLFSKPTLELHQVKESAHCSCSVCKVKSGHSTSSLKKEANSMRYRQIKGMKK